MTSSSAPSAPSVVDLTTHDDSALLLLCEMFPDLSVDALAALIDQAPANSSPHYLVDLAIQLQSSLPPHPTTSSPPSPSHAYEMMSLLPAHSDPSAPSFPVPSAPTISAQHADLLSAVAAVHGGLLSSPTHPTTLHAHLHSLLRVVTNPLEHPDVQKYRVLPLANPKFVAKVLSLNGAQEVLQAVGFVELRGEGVLILADERFDAHLLQEAQQLLEEELSFVSSTIPPPAQPQAQGQGRLQVKERPSVVDHPLYKSKREWREESKSGQVVQTNPILVRTPRLSRAQLAEVAEHRLKPKSTPTPVLPGVAASTEVRRGRQMRLEDVRRRRLELEAMRRDKKSDWLNTAQGRRRVITIDDLEKMRLEEVEQRARLGMGMSDEELVAIGKEATRLTNEFRKSQGLALEVQWHSHLAEIGWKHSKNMGEGKVPFGHDGFKGRHEEMRMSAAGENVFMCEGVAAAHVAKMGVDGWINSPGHRRNMLGKEWVFSGIGVYRKGNGFWLTQLFARP